MSVRIHLLKKALTVLAQSGEEQLAHLKALGVEGNLDEIALEFDDISAAAKDMWLCHELSEDQCRLVTALREELRQMSALEDPTLWSAPGVLNRGEWAEIRQKARACLAAL